MRHTQSQTQKDGERLKETHGETERQEHQDPERHREINKDKEAE